MKRVMFGLVAGTLLSGAAAVSAPSQKTEAKVVTLTRLDCGAAKAQRDITGFSDVYAFEGMKRQLVASCYLIRHGEDYMLWDTGYPAASRDDPNGPIALKATVIEQISQLGLTPEKIGRVGVSHYHGDHIGQARDFPGATLVIGARDWAALTAAERAPGVDPAPLAPWISGGSKVETVRGDKDLFGDGTVVVLDTPGHTPGHTSLLVKLAGRTILLTGDLTHFAETYAVNGVPRGNTSRAETLASLDRFKTLATNLKATVIIQHDPADIAKLPAFPAAAR